MNKKRKMKKILFLFLIMCIPFSYMPLYVQASNVKETYGSIIEKTDFVDLTN